MGPAIRGGARPGAGRPKKGDVRVQGTVPQDVADYLLALGDGDYSAGFVEAVHQLRRRSAE